MTMIQGKVKFNSTFLGVCLVLYGLFGCGEEDVSKSSNFAKIAKTTRKTKISIALTKDENMAKGRECPADFEQAFNRNAADRAVVDPQHTIIAVLPAGTIIQIERLVQLTTTEGGIYVDISVSAGPNSGLHFKAPISLFVPNIYLHPGDPSNTHDTWEVSEDKLEKP